MPKLISPLQAAFTLEKNIQENIILTHKAIHSLKGKKSGSSGNMVIKLDMEKAFDRVDWDFLQPILEKQGFASTWISMINFCIHTVQYSVSVNGSPTSFFKATRGLRQGCPLSPYLFILVSDALSRLFSHF